MNSSDHAQYLSWYKAFQSQALISNLQTSEPNPPVFFNLLWWGLAQIGRISGLDYTIVYQMFRWISGTFFLSMTYAFIALFFSSITQRRIAFLLIASGAGFGWVLVVLKYALRQPDVMFSADLYVAEGNSFLCILGYPHFSEAAGLILAVIALLLLGERRGQLRYAVYAGLTALFLGWQHGYDLLIVWIVPTAYAGVLWLITRRWPQYWFKAMLITGLISWPPALYSVLLTQLNPIWKQVLAQFTNAGVYSPDLLHSLILMGAPLLFALTTFVLLLRDGLRGGKPERIQQNLFLMTWLIVGWVLIYIPTDFQIHMINSWQVPISMLAALGLSGYFIPEIKQRWPNLKIRHILTAVAVFCALTNLYLFAWRFLDLSRYQYPYYLYRDEIAAMEWLEKNTPADSVVFSSYDVGRYIPGLSGRIGFLSHWAQTVDFFNKRDLAARYYGGQLNEAEIRQALQNYGIDYLFYGPAERALASQASGSQDPIQNNFLILRYSSAKVQIYQVQLP